MCIIAPDNHQRYVYKRICKANQNHFYGKQYRFASGEEREGDQMQVGDEKRGDDVR